MQANPVVILTREPEDNRELAGKLRPLGIEVMDYPCIRTFLLPFGELSYLPGNGSLTDFDVFVFTSKRGVAGMVSAAHFLSDPGVMVAVVGRTTAEAVEKVFGRSADIVAETSTGENLAGLLIQRFKNIKNNLDHSSLPKILHICGNKSLHNFKNLMEEHGFGITELEVYRNERPEVSGIHLTHSIERCERAIVVFASPSAVDYFFEINKTDRIKRDWIYLAIGRTTGAFLKSMGIGEVIESPVPRVEEIVRIIKKQLINNK